LTDQHAAFLSLFSPSRPILAPMEDVTDSIFRRLCRKFGATTCVTEFVNVEGLLRGCRHAKRKSTLAADDQPTAIQIYGADADRLVEAAEKAAQAGPAFIDINCGCWVPKIAARGAGAAWLRDPDAMVVMAGRIVKAVPLPVTVKTRIGWDEQSGATIADIAPRLEQAGVAAITVHCRTARMGHKGEADWSWAARVRAAVKIPVIVNGDIKSAEDADRAIGETGCAAVMVGRRAIDHPWIFREIRSWMEQKVALPSPTAAERIALCKEHLVGNVEARGEHFGVCVTRRHLSGYLKGLRGAASLRRRLVVCDSLKGCLEILDEALGAQPS
jgi:nifR3 family TIM-barrel protein